MSKYSNRPKDYDLDGFLYDARVLAAQCCYLNLQHQAPLVLGEFGPDADHQIETDLAGYAEILDSRADGIHRPVRVRDVNRLVCTCALVVRTEDRFREPAGHLDACCRPARTVIVDLGGDTEIIAACQGCGASTTVTDLRLARSWAAEHACPPRPVPPGDAHGSTFDAFVIEEGMAPDDIVHRARTQMRNDAAPSGHLIPWDFHPRHRLAYTLAMLRHAERVHHGATLRDGDAQRLAEWTAKLRDLNAVVTYDPASPQGFLLVPREEGDEDLIRRPKA
ncbi:hypothetical protein Xcel_0243 [Xylanimonas cellulosilytica DSM 15894]|uniref:Uncharacterized protein n=1 Tax=Xylanimonas cellulosilytica (strain DSM 15894 / JCM 12276 / CECT 5975 / KCTC 9989 / LMG 20990 / NBRC 107835 / XIL07) TaxID=446471 RepID=D1BUP1_XYLCX|nr:hypothetical protein [Xylanimonas cellulosilytica]ACZ29282.1 hypothetical protein Xcel_0243 [Xylanimonas cellulosilytica DSM 15894]